jgi:hypothetical protein
MANWLGKLLFKGRKREGSDQEEKRRQALLRGPTTGIGKSVLEGIPVVGTKDEWTREKERQQEIITQQFQQQKREIVRQRRRAEMELKKSLETRYRRIKSRYEKVHRMGRYGKSDADEIIKAERDTERKYRSEERQMKRQHHENWQTRMRELQRWRDKERRNVTERMRTERRKLLGVPGKKQLPWEF